MINVAIVGAGPAGVAAADVLVAHGVAVTVIDEGREAGGQIYRRARAGLKLDVDLGIGLHGRVFPMTELAKYAGRVR